ncbi:hypothetical protein ACQZV8_14945 [Magnetococcales bacterium HHB-1]
MFTDQCPPCPNHPPPDDILEVPPFLCLIALALFPLQIVSLLSNIDSFIM